MKTFVLNSARSLAILGALSATAAITAPAYAISPQTQEVSVKIDARDLATDRGVERVYKTLAKKAKSSCEISGTRGIEDKVAEKECAKALLRDFVESTDNVKLSSYYALQTATT